MWTNENRPRYNRDKLRYPSNLTDGEWSWVEPLIPPAKRGGRRRQVGVRDVLNEIMYVLSTGCQSRYVPRDLPPRSTLHVLHAAVGSRRHPAEDPSYALTWSAGSSWAVRPVPPPA